MGDEYDAAEIDAMFDYYSHDSFYNDEYDDDIDIDDIDIDYVAINNAQLPEISIRRGGIRFPIPTASPGVTGALIMREHPGINTKEQIMRTNDTLLAEAQELRDKAEQLERIATEREKYGADIFKNGTVLKIDMKYRTGTRSYAYACIKIGGRFYLSGKMGVQPMDLTGATTAGMSWDNFVAWLAQGDATVWQAGSLKQVY